MFKFSILTNINMVGLFAASLILFSPGLSLCDQNQEEQHEALKAVVDATYKQFGIDENINNYIQNLIPIKYKKYVENVAPIAETISKKRLELKWEF